MFRTDELYAVHVAVGCLVRVCRLRWLPSLWHPLANAPATLGVFTTDILPRAASLGACLHHPTARAHFLVGPLFALPREPISLPRWAPFLPYRESHFLDSLGAFTTLPRAPRHIKGIIGVQAKSIGICQAILKLRYTHTRVILTAL